MTIAPRVPRRGFLGLCLLLGCSGEAVIVDPPVVTVGFTVLSKPGSGDTIGALPIQAIAIRVADNAGRVREGVLVGFRGLPGGPQQQQVTMFLRPPGSAERSSEVALRTDSRGEALTPVQFGDIPGPGGIEVSVLELGMKDTVSFVVIPGGLASISVTPRDTAIQVGGTGQVNARALDRLGNARPATINWQLTSTPAGVADITPGGLVTATAPSRLTIVAEADVFRDTVQVSFVPPGAYLAASVDPTTLITANLDGTNRRVVRSAPFHSVPEAAWAPIGSEIVLDGNEATRRLELVSSTGQVTPVVFDGTTTGEPRWPGYSPDGQSLYFTGVEGGILVTGIFKVHREGTALSVISPCLCFRVSAAPDGRYLVWHTPDASGEVVVIQVHDLVTHTAVGSEVPGRFPQWSPTGNLIAFKENEGDRLKVMNPDGSGVRYVSPVGRAYEEEQLSWSPDGVWLLARSAEGLELIQVATGLILPLPGTGRLHQPAWRP